jgi:phosphate-selective porin OprO and OprP
MDFRKELTAISLVAIFMYNSNCFAQESKPSMKMFFGKGIQFTSSDSLFTMALSGRIQSLFEAKNDLTNETFGADFLVRRSRLNIQGTALNPNFTYRIQIGFAQGDISSGNSAVQNNLVLRDAMLFYKANKWLRLGFGQTKLPGNRQRQVSSANLQLVERSIANNNFTLDRDKGIWFYTNFHVNKSVLRATAAISSGEGRIVSDKNGKLAYALRTEFLPFGLFSNNGDYVESAMEREYKPKLSLAAAYSFNDNATRTMGQFGEFLHNAETANIQYYGGDLMFKYGAFSLESEVYHRNSNTGIFINNGDISQQNYVIAGTAFMIQSGYFVSKTNEIAMRYAQITPETKVAVLMNAQKEYVFGFSHYFYKHSLKLQTNVTYLENGSNNSLISRLSGVVTF